MPEQAPGTDRNTANGEQPVLLTDRVAEGGQANEPREADGPTCQLLAAVRRQVGVDVAYLSEDMSMEARSSPQPATPSVSG